MRILLSLLAPMFAFAAQPIFRPVPADAAASGHSSVPMLSVDARHVIFASDAPNAAPGVQGNGWIQLYRQSLETSNVTLVTVNAAGNLVHGNCELAAASASNRFVAFVTDAQEVVEGDVNRANDLFLRDIESGITHWVTRPLIVQPLPSWFQHRVGAALMSQDGQWLFFESLAPNLTEHSDTNWVYDVFAYHRTLRTNVLVVAAGENGTSTPTNGARLMSITPDGSRVAVSFPPSPWLSAGEIYVLDRQTGERIHASTLSSFFSTAYQCTRASISANGRFVAMTVMADGSPPMLFRRDLESSATDVIASNVIAWAFPQISSNGSTIVFEDGTNVYRWHSSVTQVINVTTNGALPVTGIARNAQMNSDGTHVSFVSNSSGLSTNSPGGVFQIYCRDVLTGETWLATQTTEGRPGSGSAEHSSFQMSPDGSFVVFDSTTADFATNDNNRASDIFIRSRAADSAQLLSRNRGAPRQTALGHACVAPLCISSNGDVVAFLSGDSDVLSDDTNRFQNAYAADLVSGTLASAGLTNPCRAVALSANGRFLVTRGEVLLDGLFIMEVRRHDLATGATLFIHGSPESRSTEAPAISPDGNSVAYITGSSLRLYNVSTATEEFAFGPQVSPFLHTRSDALFSADGRFVLFQSSSNGIELRLYDRTTRQTETITATGGAFSANSRFLVCATNGSPFGVVLRRDLLAQTMADFKLPGFSPNTISDDGRFVVGTFRSSPASREQQILLLDWETRATNILSVSASGEPGIGRSQWPAISANGRYVAYSTDAANIVPGNAPFRQQVVLRDVLLGSSTLLSAAINGEPGDAFSSRPILSADGRTIVFQSMASNLTPGDYNNARDIFIVKIGDADTDGDGMDDDWEVAFFGNMTRNGSADFDGDGITDGAEFLAGTDPTNGNSVFRVMIMARLGDSGRTVIWSGSPGRAYRVEYKDELSDSDWKVLPASPVWVGNTARAEDPAPGSSRFYRVVRRP